MGFMRVRRKRHMGPYTLPLFHLPNMLGSWPGLIFSEATVRKVVVCLRVKIRMDIEVEWKGCYMPLLSGSEGQFRCQCTCVLGAGIECSLSCEKIYNPAAE